MMYVADTNVVSELMKRETSSEVLNWFQDHEGRIYLTAVTIKELYYGMLRLPEGKRKRALRDAITAIVMECSDKTLAFDGYSGYLCAEMHEMAVSAGKTPTIEDLMIAAICKRHDAVLATRNVKDFEHLGIDLVNPFEYESETLKRLRKEEEERRQREA